MKKERDLTKTSPSSLDYPNLTEDDLLSIKGGTLLILWLARQKSLYLVPKKAITKKVLLTVPKEKDHDKKSSVIHYLAKTEEFKHIPKDILTEELLSTKGLDGRSVYHTLAEQHLIGLLPKRLITHSALTLESATKWTPLHSIAHHTPHLIPKDAKLEDALLKSEKNITVLHTWANGSGWVDIPKEFLTKGTLQLEDAAEQTPFSQIINQFEYESSYRKRFVGKDMVLQLKHVLSQASTKQLKEIVNNPEDYEELTPLVKEELLKRKIVKKLSKTNQSLEI
jgi:putative transposon-encoded protein